MNNKKILHNISWILGARVLQAFLALCISTLTARYLGPSNFGVLHYGISIAAFFAPLARLGLDGILVRELLRSPGEEGKILGTSIAMGLVSSVFCIAGILGFLQIANPGDRLTRNVCLLYSLTLLAGSGELIQYWFQAKLLSKYTAAVTLICYTLMSGYQLFLLATGKDIRWFALAKVLELLLMDILLLILYRRLGPGKLSFSRDLAGKLLAKSKYYILSSILVAVYAQTDRIMLSHLMGSAETGYYSAAMACAGLSTFFFTALLDSFRPAVLESAKSGISQLEQRMQQLYAIILFFSLGQAAAVSLFGDGIIRFLYGNAYRPSGALVKLLIWYTVFSYLASARNIWILSQDQQKYLWILNLFGALANVLLNFLWIPKWGGKGAALATVLTQTATAILIPLFFKELRRGVTLLWDTLSFRTFRRG